MSRATIMVLISWCLITLVSAISLSTILRIYFKDEIDSLDTHTIFATLIYNFHLIIFYIVLSFRLGQFEHFLYRGADSTQPNSCPDTFIVVSVVSICILGFSFILALILTALNRNNPYIKEFTEGDVLLLIFHVNEATLVMYMIGCYLVLKLCEFKRWLENSPT